MRINEKVIPYTLDEVDTKHHSEVALPIAKGMIKLLGSFLNKDDYSQFLKKFNIRQFAFPEIDQNLSEIETLKLLSTLFYSKTQIDLFEITKKFPTDLVDRINRIKEYAGIFSLYTESKKSAEGYLRSKTSPSIEGFCWRTEMVGLSVPSKAGTVFFKAYEKTIVPLTTIRLLQLFNEIFKLEFQVKNNAFLGTGALIKVKDLRFLAKLEDNQLQIILDSHARSIQQGFCCIQEVVNISWAVTHVFKRTPKAFKNNKDLREQMEKTLRHEITIRERISPSKVMSFDLRDDDGTRLIGFSDRLYTENFASNRQGRKFWLGNDPKKYSEFAMVISFSLIAEAQRLWDKGILHRNICMSNILYHNDILGASLSSFGSSRSATLQPSTPLTHQPKVTCEYDFAILTKAQKEHSDKSSIFEIESKIEVFQLGIVLFDLFTGDSPFSKYNANGYPDPQHKFDTSTLTAHYLPEYGQLIEKMLTFDLKQRISLEGFRKTWTEITTLKSAETSTELAAKPESGAEKPEVAAAAPGLFEVDYSMPSFGGDNTILLDPPPPIFDTNTTSTIKNAEAIASTDSN